MSENDMRNLTGLFSKILEVIREISGKIVEAVGYLKKIPELLEALGKKILEGFRDQIQAMGEMEVYIRLAQIRSKKELINLEKLSIEDLKSQLKEDSTEIDNRYSKIQAGLNEDAYKRIRELDGHLVELYEKYYPAIFTDFFKDKLNNYYNIYFTASRDAYEERLSNFLNQVKETLLAMENFFNQRMRYQDNVKNYLFDENPDEDEHFYLPLCLVETENSEENSHSFRTFLPGEFINNKKLIKLGKITTAFIEAQEFSGIKQYFIDSTHMDKFEWIEEQEYKNNLSSRLEEFFSESSLPKKVLNAYLKNIERSNIKTIKF